MNYDLSLKQSDSYKSTKKFLTYYVNIYAIYALIIINFAVIKSKLFEMIKFLTLYIYFVSYICIVII